jgi:pullulanase/glycogen debranching enzyme
VRPCGPYRRTRAARPAAKLGFCVSSTRDWPRYTCRDAIVYELHVKGFTARPNSGVTPAKRGTFAGLTVMINGHWEDHSFTVHEGQASEWRRVVDTARSSPDDIVGPEAETALETASYTVRARSVVVLRRGPRSSGRETPGVSSTET